ncbi:hypothetical protein [Campylobacter suis]|uniref:ABC-type transport auxiliary lipoprotein component domain-containing protein n=1 Tax=Campylobacter suis TaxID=2790657 RepID=A0ABN7K5C9_9BACT|nr:hypothetical protein [Campylobacter suis]CAD7286811.1 hypothetical protein LMG8286_00549 [Campylobacter suis]
MRGILVVFLAVFISGCSLKNSVARADMYEIYYSQKECVAKSKTPKNIYIQNVSALDLVDKREILIVAEDNKIHHLYDAKFIAQPSEMIYKALIKGAYANCGVKPIFSPNSSDLRLKVNVVSLQIRGDKAEVILAYELFSLDKSVNSGVVVKNVFCPDPSSKSIFDSINKSVNLAIDELLGSVI